MSVYGAIITRLPGEDGDGQAGDPRDGGRVGVLVESGALRRAATIPAAPEPARRALTLEFELLWIAAFGKRGVKIHDHKSRLLEGEL